MEKLKREKQRKKERNSAEFFQLLWENAPKNKNVYLTASILLILFQTGFIFSEELSIIYEENLSSDKKIDKRSILRIDSFFNKLSGFFDIIVIARRFSPGVLTFLLGLIFISMFFIAISFKNFGTIKKWIKYKKSIRNTNFFILCFSTMMMNYDIFFFIMTNIGFNSIPCRWIWVSEKKGSDVNYLEANSFENEFFNAWKGEGQEEMVLRQVSYLNDEIVCKSNQHFFAMMIGICILMVNFYLKYMANKLMKFIPSYKVFACKYGNSDLVYDFILILILVTKSLAYIYLKDSYNWIRLIFLGYFIILICGYIVLFKFKPYYNYEQHKLKCFQALYLLNLTWFSILVRETDFRIFNSEISMIIFMILTMTIILKLNDNLSRLDVEQLIEKTKKTKFIQPQDLLNIYYMIVDFVKVTILKDNKRFLTGDKKVDDAAFLINYFLEQHRKKCVKVYCYCKGSKVSFKISSMEYFREKIEGTMLYDAMMVLNELLLEGIKIYGNKDKYIVYCYSNYLINYLGMPSFAHNFIRKRIHFLKKENINKENVETEVELNSLLCLLERVAWKNLDKGTLSLVALRKEIGDYNKKSNEIRILDHVLFLNKHEMVKEDVIKAMDLKVDFLKTLRFSGDLLKCYNISKNFYLLKKSIIKNFEILNEKADKKYSPLLFTYGYFMLNCGQDRIKAQKLLKEFNKTMFSANNLHKIFSDLSFREKELAIVYVSGEDQDFHKIIYSSSNMFKWTGFPSKSLLLKDLGMLVPSPISLFHQELLDIENTTGKLLMNNRLNTMLVSHRDGYEVPTKLGVRVNSNIYNRVDYVGAFNFELNGVESCILVTSKQGRIMSMTKSAKEYFELEHNMSIYNPDFISIFKNLNKVAEEKLVVEDKGEKYEIIIKDGERMKAWETYCDFSSGKMINIKTKTGEVIQMEIIIDDYLVYQIQESIRYIIIKSAKNKIFNTLNFNKEKKLKEEKSLKKIYDYFRQEKMKEEKLIDERDIHEENIALIEEEGISNTTPRFQTGLLKHFSTNKSNLGSKSRNSLPDNNQSGHIPEEEILIENRNEKRRSTHNLREFEKLEIKKSKSNVPNEGDNLEIIQEVRKEKVSTESKDDSREKGEEKLINQVENPEVFKIEAISIDEENESKTPSPLIKNLGLKTLKGILLMKGKSKKSINREKSVKSNPYSSQRSMGSGKLSNNKKKKKSNILNLHRELKIGKLNIRRIKTKSEKSSSGGSINAKRIRGSMIEKIIQRYYKPEKTTSIYWVSFLIMVFFFIIHLLSVEFKDPVQKMTNSDIKEQAVNVDVFSWEIWANVYTVFFSDVCRATKEGWIENESSIQDFNLTMFGKCHTLMKSAGSFQMPPDDLIDIKVRNITFMNLYEYERFVMTEFKIPVFTVNHESGELLGWENITFSRRGGMKYFHEMSKRITGGRDYENDTSIVKLGSYKNRELDYEMDQVRRIAIGDLNYKYALRSYDFYDYLKGVAIQNEMFIKWSIAIPCIITILIFFIYTIYVIFEVKAMRFFYKTLFQTEVDFLDYIINIYQRKAKELKYMLLEEKVYEDQARNLILNDNDHQTTQNLEKKNHKRKEKVKLHQNKNTFGFMKLIFIFALTIALIISMQFSYYLILSPKGNKITNLVKVYILAVELWCAYATIHTMAFETILWNNTLPVWNTDSLSAYKRMHDHIKNNIIPNFTEALDYEMGNYTEIYINQISKVTFSLKFFFQGNSCETVWGIEAKLHYKCNEYYDGLLNSNFLNSIKGVLSTLDFYIQQWELNNQNWDEVLKLFQKKSLRMIFTQLQPTLTTMYYSLTTDMTNTLMSELDEDLDFVKLSTYFMLVALFIGTLVIYYNVVVRVKALLRDFKSALWIFPVSLLEKNLILKHHFKRVGKGHHIYKI